jgi:hypothetical protein
VQQLLVIARFLKPNLSLKLGAIADNLTEFFPMTY